MAFSKEQYLQQALALLPNGLLWDGFRQPGSGVYEMLEACAEEFARIDARRSDLRNELDPRSSLELQPEWEVFSDMPDVCSLPGETLQERRQLVVSKLTYRGGQSRQFYLDLAASLGYTIEIYEYKPFVCGISRCGDNLHGGHDVRHTWRIHITGPRITRFRCGPSQCGDKLLKITRAEGLECKLRQINQAHRNLIISYGGV